MRKVLLGNEPPKTKGKIKSGFKAQRWQLNTSRFVLEKLTIRNLTRPTECMFQFSRTWTTVVLINATLRGFFLSPECRSLDWTPDSFWTPPPASLLPAWTTGPPDGFLLSPPVSSPVDDDVTESRVWPFFPGPRETGITTVLQKGWSLAVHYTEICSPFHMTP
jgi:hypothetical protein